MQVPLYPKRPIFADNPGSMGGMKQTTLRTALMICTVASLALGAGLGEGVIVTATAAPSVNDGNDNGDNERYVFPMAAPRQYMSWTELHWDGGRAVDIEAAPELSAHESGYRRVSTALVLAVTSGVARPADNPRGGIAVVLQGDDGKQYYYAHLSERRVDEPRRVEAGAVLGRVGRTGRWTRYLEPHLHFAVATGHHEGLGWQNDVYASHWIREHFGLAWRKTPADRARRAAAAARDSGEPPTEAAVGYPAAVPRGWPFPAAGTVAESFEELAARNEDLAGLRVRPPRSRASASTQDSGALEQSRVAVIAPLAGEVNVVRDGVLGARVQVTNRPAEASVILSGLRGVTVRDGAIVRAGTQIGTIDREDSLLYHYFLDGTLVDPEPSLARAEQGLD